MKKITLLLFFSIIVIPAFSQETIKISADLELLKLSEEAFIHISYVSSPEFGRYSSNGLVFINGNETILFDTPPNDEMTGVLCDFLEKNMKLNIRGFVPNHWHEDCIGGLNEIRKRNIPSYANSKTIDIARSHNLPLPDHGFTDSLRLMLGDKSITCWFPGPAHSMDNIVVWIPSEKILFPGCMCKSLNTPNLGNVADGDIRSYAATIGKVIQRFGSAGIVIPGHGAPGGTELLFHTKALAEK